MNDLVHADWYKVNKYNSLVDIALITPMFQQVYVKVHQATPLYKDLIKATGEAPKWSFHKYLIGRDGRTITSYSSRTAPDDKAVVAAIEASLAGPRPAAPATPP